MRELYLVPETERRLFAGIDTDVTPFSELGASFEIEAGSRAEKETLRLSGPLTAGTKTVRMALYQRPLGRGEQCRPKRPSRPARRAQLRGSRGDAPRAGDAAVAGGLQELER